jgi:hypothetical protein
MGASLPPDSSAAALFTPWSRGRLRLRNRIVMAPMTRERATDGAPGPDVLAYYTRRAQGGTGLIITEGLPPDAAGAFGSTVPRFFGPQRAQWRAVVDAVHAQGACIVPQLWHVGAFDPSLIGMGDSAVIERVSPSGLAAPGRPLGRAMTERDIADTLAAYADAAAGARALGFDGVEIHGAHGYLPDQFLWAGTNRAHRRLGWRPAGPHPLRDRAGAGLPARDCARLSDPVALFAMEAAGLRRPAGRHARPAAAAAGCAGGCRRGHLPLLDAALLAAGLRR